MKEKKNKKWYANEQAAAPAPAKVETPAAEAVVVVAAAEAPMKVDFDSWWALRRSRIPKQHHKEIIKADFKARQLGQCESMEDFDKALEKYGVKLS